jgi:hypothetical protein
LGGAGAHGHDDEEDEEEGGRLPLGRQGQPLALDVDAPTEVNRNWSWLRGGLSDLATHKHALHRCPSPLCRPRRRTGKGWRPWRRLCSRR